MKRLDPRTKLLLVLGLSLLAVTLDQWFSLLALFGLALFLFLWAQPKSSYLKGTFLLAALTTWGVIFSQGLFYQDFPRTVLLYLIPPFELWGWHCQGLAIYWQGLYYGAVQSLRFNAGMLAGLALCLSTPVERLYEALSGLPIPRGLSFLSVSAIRFLPIVAEEFRNVRLALRLKGYQPLRCGVRETLRTELLVPLPVLAGAIRRARELSDSLLTRGFDPLSRNPSKKTPWPWQEKVAVGLFLGLCVSILAAKLLFWLYLQEIIYWGRLRGLYAFVRNWL